MKFWLSVTYLTPDEAIDMAVAADELGYHGITTSDHFFFAEEYASKYPYSPDGSPPFDANTPWPDPWVLTGAMAARTSNLHFMTNIYVAPARDLFTVAKLISSAAVVSHGRVAAGFGAGWCEEEFVQTGQDFATRGKRLNEMIPVLRKLWSGETITHRGEYFDFPELSIAPVPSEPIPIYVGGDSKAAHRRAATLGDGWIGNLYRIEQAEEILGRVDAAQRDAGREAEPFEKIIALMAIPDPELYRRFEDAGVTGMLCAPWMMVEADRDARLRALEDFARDVIAKT